MSANSCFVAVLIARSHDRFRLCNVTDTAFQQAKGQAAANSLLREHVDRVVDRMQPAEGIQSFDSSEVTYFALKGPVLTCVVVGNKSSSIVQQHGPAVLENAACTLLDQIQSEFLAHYPAEVVMAANKPFQFLNWDRQLTKLLRTAQLNMQKSAASAAPHPSATVGAHTTLSRRTAAQGAAVSGGGGADGSSPAYDALKKELASVHGVMKRNLDDILTRGESLETVSAYSAQLKDGTQGYYKRTVHMNRMRMLQTYGPPAFVFVMVLVWVWWYLS
uniref:V-SNARE coiled-coil homology domain-containing protein n=1 Tax=Neobodo designis TaxID=312471 RepID=A0A7S1KZR5_NEODS